MRILLALLTTALLSTPAFAGLKEDAEMTELMVRPWNSPRHSYQYEADGTWYMLPKIEGGTSGKWEITDGKLIQGKDSYKIISLTSKEIKYSDGKVVYTMLSN